MGTRTASSSGTLYLTLFVVVATAPIAGAIRPIRDVDIYWHQVLGEEILATRTVTGIGDTWAWYDPPEPWTTSQWLSEVVIALLVRLGDWDALVIATVFTTAAILTAVAWQILSRTDPRTGIVVFAPFAFSMLLFVDVRPLLLSALATAVVAHFAERTLTDGVAPPLWTLALVALWSNFHGQWIIAPIAVGLAAVLNRLAQGQSSRDSFRRSMLFVFLAPLAGSINPLGVQSLLLPLTFSQSTRHISEWQLTTPWRPTYVIVAVLLAVIVYRWMTTAPPSWPVVLYTVFWVVFSLIAFRNIFIATLMLIPVAARAQGTARGRPEDPSRPASRLPVVAALVFPLTVVAVGATRSDALEVAEPVRIAEKLSASSGSVRVLNDYDTAGILVAFGPPGIELGIDGRADRYPAEYVNLYFDTLDLRGTEWRSFLEDFEPEVAVIELDSAVRHLLIDDWNWQVTMQDGQYALIEP